MIAATKDDLAEPAAPSESVGARFVIGAFWALVGAVLYRVLGATVWNEAVTLIALARQLAGQKVPCPHRSVGMQAR